MVSLIVIIAAILRLLQPLQERLTGLANFLARLAVDVFLADMGTPLLHNLLLEHIDLVERHEDLRDGGDEIGVADSDKALDTSEKRLLMLLRRHHLCV